MSRDNGNGNGLGQSINRTYDPDACPRCGHKMVQVGNEWRCTYRRCPCVQEGFKGSEWKAKPVPVQEYLRIEEPEPVAAQLDMFGE